MTRFMTRWSIVGLCLGASLALGCDDPAPKTDDKEATKEATTPQEATLQEEKATTKTEEATLQDEATKEETPTT